MLIRTALASLCQRAGSYFAMALTLRPKMSFFATTEVNVILSVTNGNVSLSTWQMTNDNSRLDSSYPSISNLILRFCIILPFRMPNSECMATSMKKIEFNSTQVTRYLGDRNAARCIQLLRRRSAFVSSEQLRMNNGNSRRDAFSDKVFNSTACFSTAKKIEFAPSERIIPRRNGPHVFRVR